jgi:hypothetical protein
MCKTDSLFFPSANNTLLEKDGKRSMQVPKEATNSHDPPHDLGGEGFTRPAACGYRGMNPAALSYRWEVIT